VFVTHQLIPCPLWQCFGREQIRVDQRCMMKFNLMMHTYYYCWYNPQELQQNRWNDLVMH